MPTLRLIKVSFISQIPLFSGRNTSSLTDPREVPGRGPRGSQEGAMGSDVGPQGPERVWKGSGWGLTGTEVHRRSKLHTWVVRYHSFAGILLPGNGLSRCSSSLLPFKRVRFEEKKSKFQNTTFQYHIPYHSEKINKWYEYRYDTGKSLALSVSECRWDREGASGHGPFPPC